ncbi:MAG: hypothetical protein V4629_10680, partial [Pseudomonadota bacterium]
DGFFKISTYLDSRLRGNDAGVAIIKLENVYGLLALRLTGYFENGDNATMPFFKKKIYSSLFSKPILS